MIEMLKRHEIQVLRRAHVERDRDAQRRLRKTARRIAAEDPVAGVDNIAERSRRQVGRPSKAEASVDAQGRQNVDAATSRSVHCRCRTLTNARFQGSQPRKPRRRHVCVVGHAAEDDHCSRGHLAATNNPGRKAVPSGRGRDQDEE